MFLSATYIVLYTGAGLATGFFTKADKTTILVGMVLAAIAGGSFGVSYAIVSAIEFGVGIGVAVMLQGGKGESE